MRRSGCGNSWRSLLPHKSKWSLSPLGRPTTLEVTTCTRRVRRALQQSEVAPDAWLVPEEMSLGRRTSRRPRHPRPWLPKNLHDLNLTMKDVAALTWIVVDGDRRRSVGLSLSLVSTREEAMAKISPCHSSNPSDPDVYHDHDDCPTGQQIPAPEQVARDRRVPPLQVVRRQGLGRLPHKADLPERATWLPFVHISVATPGGSGFSP